MFNQIKQDLQNKANPKKAQILQRFFKTCKGEYGEGDVFLGVVVPECRKVVNAHKDASFTVLQKLMQSKIHEHRLVGVLILVEQFKKADRLYRHPERSASGVEGYNLSTRYTLRQAQGDALVMRKKIFDFYLKNAKQVNNWDLVDLSASHIGAYLLDKNTSILIKLAKSKNLWERRIAIMMTFAFIRENRFDETFRIAELLLSDSHDLIHKAVGWMLREVGKRDLKSEEVFLKKHYKKMPRTMLRYAIEKFEETKRKKYLKGII